MYRAKAKLCRARRRLGTYITRCSWSVGIRRRGRLRPAACPPGEVLKRALRLRTARGCVLYLYVCAGVCCWIVVALVPTAETEGSEDGHKPLLKQVVILPSKEWRNGGGPDRRSPDEGFRTDGAARSLWPPLWTGRSALKSQRCGFLAFPRAVGCHGVGGGFRPCIFILANIRVSGFGPLLPGAHRVDVGVKLAT